MGLVDKTVILRKLSELETYLKQIREFAGITLQVYNADWRTQRIVERTIQMMIETCADIAGHIVSDRGMRAPEDYTLPARPSSQGSPKSSILECSAVVDSSQTGRGSAFFMGLLQHSGALVWDAAVSFRVPQTSQLKMHLSSIVASFL